MECLEGYDADFNACDYNDRTALHLAASSGHDLVKWLLEGEGGANVHVSDVNNEASLLAAVKACNLKIFRVGMKKIIY